MRLFNFLFFMLIIHFSYAQEGGLYKSLRYTLDADLNETQSTVNLIMANRDEALMLADSIMNTSLGNSKEENVLKFQIASSIFHSLQMAEKECKAQLNIAHSYIVATGFYSTYSESNMLAAEACFNKAIAIGRREGLYDQLGSTYWGKSYIYSTNLMNNDGSRSEDYFNSLDSSIYFYVKGEKRPSVGLASSYSSYGRKLQFGGKPAASLSYFYRSIQEFKQVPNAKELPDVYGSLGTSHSMLNSLDSAIHYYMMASQFSKDRNMIAQQLYYGIEQAQTYNQAGKLDLALAKLDELMTVAKGLYLNPQAREFSAYQQGVIKFKKGLFYRSNERLDEAMSAYLDASKELEKLGKTSPELGQAYYGISVLENQKFNFENALLFADKYITNSTADTMDLVNGYINKSQIYLQMGNSNKSLEQMLIATELFDKMYRVPGFMALSKVQRDIQTLGSIASYFYKIKLFDKSIEYFEKGLEIANRNNLVGHQMTFYFQAAISYSENKEYYKSTAYLTKWLELSQKFNVDPELQPLVILFIVGTYELSGDREEAIDLFESTNLLELLENDEIPLNRLMRVLIEVSILGEEDQVAAIRKLDEAVLILDSMNTTPDTKYPLYSLFGDQYAAFGASDKAISYYQKSIELIYEVLNVAGSSDVQDRYLSLSYDVVKKIIPILVEEQKPTAVFNLIETSKARSLRKMLFAKSNEVAKNEVNDIRHLQDSLYTLLREDQLSQETMDQVTLQIERNNSILESFTLNNLPEFSSTLDLEATQQLLKGDEVLLQYVFANEHVYVLLIRSTTTDIIELSISQIEIEQSVYSLLSPFYRFNGTGNLPLFDYQLSFQLYKQLFDPIATMMTPEDQKLLIIPDGILFNLPFELLVNNFHAEGYSSKDFLISSFAITYMPSATVLGNLRAKSTDYDKDFLAMAPFSKSGRRNWEYLPFSDTYLSTYAGYFDPDRTSIILEKDASVNYLSQPQEYKISHFSTHAQTYDDKPHASSIGFYDQDLYTHQLFGLQLNTDLLILDACETGLGSIASGEGVIGFSRGFFAAGANSLILSKWKVGYQPSRELFSYFYANQAQGFHYPEALRKAKLRMIDTFRYKDNAGNIIQGIDHANPFIWSSLVYLGY